MWEVQILCQNFSGMLSSTLPAASLMQRSFTPPRSPWCCSHHFCAAYRSNGLRLFLHKCMLRTNCKSLLLSLYSISWLCVPSAIDTILTHTSNQYLNQLSSTSCIQYQRSQWSCLFNFCPFAFQNACQAISIVMQSFVGCTHVKTVGWHRVWHDWGWDPHLSMALTWIWCRAINRGPSKAWECVSSSGKYKAQDCAAKGECGAIPTWCRLLDQIWMWQQTVSVSWSTVHSHASLYILAKLTSGWPSATQRYWPHLEALQPLQLQMQHHHMKLITIRLKRHLQCVAFLGSNPGNHHKHRCACCLGAAIHWSHTVWGFSLSQGVQRGHWPWFQSQNHQEGSLVSPERVWMKRDVAGHTGPAFLEQHYLKHAILMTDRQCLCLEQDFQHSLVGRCVKMQWLHPADCVES